ncbi:MAG: Ig-like domain repeat protein [Anaerolineales bacterium]|nr:Ig-like domain repeat protein [Anaerolineales bacterium]
MQVIHIKRKSTFRILILLIILAVATPVLADYLGPDRTVTETTSVCKVVLYECQYVASKDVWRYRKAGDWSCSNEGKPWQAYSDTPSSQGCFSATAGDTYWAKEEVLREVTVTYPEAVVASALQNCTLNNGWCNTAPQLDLTATEPVSGYNILAIEGSLNGQTFACSGATCSVPLNEGANDFTFWALSSWGDSSQMGTLSANVDTVSPSAGLDITASTGTNGWYTSPAFLSAIGSDSTSGLASVLLSVDGGARQTSTTLNEGAYSVDVQAQDNAGNFSNASTTISVDTTTPTIDLSLNGTTGKNGWYISSMQVNASASDATSGIATLELTADGGAWTAVNGPWSFSDGYHTLQFKATDNAGNATTTPLQEFFVDSLAPVIDLPVQWEVNDTIIYKVQDDGSGLASLRVVIEDEDERFAKVAWNEDVSGAKFKGEIVWDGIFKDGTAAPAGTYLVWVKAQDLAGNERVGLGMVTVPSPFSLFESVLPTTPPTVVPEPPQELFEEDTPLASTPTQSPSFGGSMTEEKEITQNSLSLAGGTASTSASASSSNVLWGATAAAMLGAVTAYALEEKRKRKQVEAQQRAQVQAEVDAKNTALEAERQAKWQSLKVQNWLEGQAMLNAYLEEAQKQGATDEEIAALKQKGATVGLGTAIQDAGDKIQTLHTQNAMRQQVLEAFRAQERNDAAAAAWKQQVEEQKQREQAQAAESARWNAMAAFYASYTPAPQEEEKNWWENTKSFVNEKIVQPVQEAISTITTPAPSVPESIPHTPHLARVTPVPVQNDDPPNLFEKLIAKGKEIVNKIKAEAVETKRWFTGEDVGYTGSGWGHGPRQWIADRLGLDNSVGNLFTLGLRSLLQYDQVSLDGSVLEKIKADSAIQELEQSIIEAAKADPRFGVEAFLFEVPKDTYEFGPDRSPGNMWEQLKHPLSGLRGNTIEYVETHGFLQTVRDLIDPNKDVIKLNYADTWKAGFNELTWVTRHASVEAQVQVSEQGEIHIDYALEDELDLEPSKDRSSAYNAVTKVLGLLYHDILGGNNQMQVQANWSSER